MTDQALADVTAACDRYEAALMANDLAALDDLFWDDPRTIRYGAGENLYGIAAIREFRKNRVGGSPKRDVLKRVITLLTPDCATCNLEFLREGASRAGRQTQTWVRTEAGWKIASAHVSLIGDAS